MLRTSLRSECGLAANGNTIRFLSSNAQDFIEDRSYTICRNPGSEFLSSNAQDFIEEP